MVHQKFSDLCCILFLILYAILLAKSIARVIIYDLNYIGLFHLFTKQKNLLEARYSSAES